MSRLLRVSGSAEAVHVHRRGRLEAPSRPIHASENVQKCQRGIGEVQDGVVKDLSEKTKHTRRTKELPGYHQMA